MSQAFYGPHGDRLLLSTYDTLTRDTARALGKSYSFLGQVPFKHDFNDIGFDATEFDRRLGTPGLHAVGRAIRPRTEGKSLLPPDLVRKYAGDNFWLDRDANPNRVPVI